MLLDFLVRVCSIRYIWTWVIIDLVIVLVAHTAIVVMGFAGRTRVVFVAVYLLAMGTLVYMGSPAFAYANLDRAYLPMLAIFCFMLLSVGYSILFAFFNLNKKPQEMFIILFPLVSLALAGNYAIATGLIYLRTRYLLGFGATFGPVFLALVYLLAKISKQKKHKERYTVLFFFLFLWYSVGLSETDSDILTFSSPILLLLFVAALGLGLAKKLDRVFR